MTQTANRVLVAICTCRRPAELRRLLAAVVPQAREEGARLIVVDNDPQGSAREICAEYAVTYVIEHRAGVASARNRALRERRDCEAIAFIDDDEVPRDGWLRALIECAAKGAAAAGGPVVSVYPAQARRWVAWLGLHQRARRPDGPTSLLASGNVIISPAAFGILELPEFDVRFDESGGEDSDFFGRISQAGGTLIWTNRAVADEFVPLSRCTLRWQLARSVQTGGLEGSDRLTRQTRLTLIARACGVVLRGCLHLGCSFGFRRDELRDGVVKVTYGMGMLLAAFGYQRRAYGRRFAG